MLLNEPKARTQLTHSHNLGLHAVNTVYSPLTIRYDVYICKGYSAQDLLGSSALAPSSRKKINMLFIACIA